LSPILSPELSLPAFRYPVESTGEGDGELSTGRQRFFSLTTMPVSDWRAPFCSNVLASTSLATRALMARGARGPRAQTGHRQAPVLRTAAFARSSGPRTMGQRFPCAGKPSGVLRVRSQPYQTITRTGVTRNTPTSWPPASPRPTRTRIQCRWRTSVRSRHLCPTVRVPRNRCAERLLVQVTCRPPRDSSL